MRRLVKRILPDGLKMLLKSPRRLAEVERRTTNFRHGAIDQFCDYLIGADVPGDYCEFGVSQGRTFAYAARQLGKRYPSMRFLAFDSFEGLPEPRGIDAEQGYTSAFHSGQYACAEDAFVRNLARMRGIDLDRVLTVPGWFDQTLRPGASSIASGVERVAVAWIDCDLYESTLPVLDYLTSRLSVGAIMAFDDWRAFRNLPDRGEQRACREWLERNPQISVYPLLQFGWHGQAFTVGSC